MPNFKAQILKELVLPFEKDSVCFLYKAENQKVILLLTQVENEKFFLQIKKEQNAFLIKGDKHSKPSQIAYLQKALSVFKENFTQGIMSEAFGLKNNALIKKSPLIAENFKELLEKIQNKNPDQIYIEIGFGSGRHLLYQARKNPQILILGVEIYNPALTQVARLAKEQNTDNILLIQSDARLLLSVLKTACVQRIFLHFPVPWEKKPHRRVVSESFAKECARVLDYGGKFELRTDSFEYFDFTLKTFLEFKNVQFHLSKNRNLEISSKYEDRWKKQEKDIYDLSVWNFEYSQSDDVSGNFDLEILHFTPQNLENFARNFKRQSFKKEDYFLHFQALYYTENALILKLCLGAFNKSEHIYFLLNEKINFIFKEPFKTKENLKAIKEFKKVLLSQIDANFLEF